MALSTTGTAIRTAFVEEIISADEWRPVSLAGAVELLLAVIETRKLADVLGCVDPCRQVLTTANVCEADGSVHTANGGFNRVLTIVAMAYRAASVMVGAG